MLRQASSNVFAAQSMMDVAAATGNITAQIQEAQTLAENFLNLDPVDTARAEQFQAQYKAISKNIDSIIKIPCITALLDGSTWNNNERLSVIRGTADNPMAASMHIQAGDSGFPLTFSNMATKFSDIADQHPLDAQETLPMLSKLQNAAQNLADMYAGQASSLQSQTKSLQSQAKILDEAATQRIKTPTPVSTENILLNLILRDAGSLFSKKAQCRVKRH